MRPHLPLVTVICILSSSIVERSARGEDAGPVPDAPPHSVAAQMVNGFAIDLYTELAEANEGKNLFFSPYSITTALTMTTEGARGVTAQEMGTVLRFPETTRRDASDAQERPWDTQAVHAELKSLNQALASEGEDDPEKIQAVKQRIAILKAELEEVDERLQDLRQGPVPPDTPRERRYEKFRELSKDRKRIAEELFQASQKINQYELTVANSLWLERTFPFHDSFLATLDTYYDAAATPVDFIWQPDPSRKRINQWVEERTNGRIRDLLAEKTIDRDTRLVLANAIYFKGRWQTQFDEAQTKDGPFRLEDGISVQHPMMIGLKMPVWSAETPQCMAFELPYVGGQLSMLFLLPPRDSRLAVLEETLSDQMLQEVTARLKRVEFDQVSVPKFTMTLAYRLKDPLRRMGMPTAFEGDRADFTGMSYRGKQLYISHVAHKAFLEVNESGTEAAAATAVVMKFTFAGHPRLALIDRPFILVIRDRVSGAILFMGRVMDPR